MNNELNNIIDIIQSVNNIGIFTHVSPDGDAVGSSLGLYLGLKQLGKDVDVIVGDYSKCFEFLPGIENIKKSGKGRYDLAIVVDCASLGRVFNPESSFINSDVTIAIDHHISNTYFANYNYVEKTSPAVCKTLVKILKQLGVRIDKEIGTCLMAGIITDSGGFRYSSVDSETFMFAASMLDIGINISDIYYRTFDEKTRAQLDLSTMAVNRLRFYCDNKIALTYITLDDMNKAKALIGDHEGIVNVGRNVLGVEVSIFLREDIDNTYKVSLRSNKYVDVCEIATVFNGGGHIRGAGCTMNCSLDEAIEKLVKEVIKKL